MESPENPQENQELQ
jgi:hypothetical protein